MVVKANIPYGSILSQLRQRQLQEYQIAEERKKKKAAFTNQIAQLGGMALGAGIGTIVPGIGTMAGMGLGATAGGLGGNAMTGTPITANQGMNMLMQVGNQMNQTTNANSLAQSREIRDINSLTEQGYVPTAYNEATGDTALPDDYTVGGQAYTPGGARMGMDSGMNYLQKAKEAGYPASVSQKVGNITYKMQTPKPDTPPSSGGDDGYADGGTDLYGDNQPKYQDPLRIQREGINAALGGANTGVQARPPGKYRDKNGVIKYWDGEKWI